MQEAKIVEEKKLVKPELKHELKAQVKTLGEIEDNIQEVQDYAKELNEYYQKIVFTNETVKDAKDEKAEVNKFKKKVEDYRKEIEKEYNKPLEKFKSTAKETEKLLKETYEQINNQVNKFESEQKEKIKVLIKEYFEEKKQLENINFVEFERMNLNITNNLITEKGNLTKKATETVDLFINKIVDDLKLIETQTDKDEILVEYKKDLNVSRAITEVSQRKAELEKLAKQKEEQAEQKLTDDAMIEKINTISAPVVEEQEEVFEMTFKVRATKTKLKALKAFLDNGGYDYE